MFSVRPIEFPLEVRGAAGSFQSKVQPLYGSLCHTQVQKMNPIDLILGTRVAGKESGRLLHQEAALLGMAMLILDLAQGVRWHRRIDVVLALGTAQTFQLTAEEGKRPIITGVRHVPLNLKGDPGVAKEDPEDQPCDGREEQPEPSVAGNPDGSLSGVWPDLFMSRADY